MSAQSVTSPVRSRGVTKRSSRPVPGRAVAPGSGRRNRSPPAPRSGISRPDCSRARTSPEPISASASVCKPGLWPTTSRDFDRGGRLLDDGEDRVRRGFIQPPLEKRFRLARKEGRISFHVSRVRAARRHQDALRHQLLAGHMRGHDRRRLAPARVERPVAVGHARPRPVGFCVTQQHQSAHDGRFPRVGGRFSGRTGPSC